jgi:preprotein translocase subunit YajC
VISSVSALCLAAAGGLSSLGGLPLLLLMFVAMYFLLIAPNQRKQKQWQQMLSNLKVGDKVTTNGGMRGTIVSVKDDVLVIKTAPDNVKFEIVKSAIAAVTTEDEAKS